MKTSASWWWSGRGRSWNCSVRASATTSGVTGPTNGEWNVSQPVRANVSWAKLLLTPKMVCPLWYRAGSFPQESHLVSSHQHQPQAPLLRIRDSEEEGVAFTLYWMYHSKRQGNNISVLLSIQGRVFDCFPTYILTFNCSSILKSNFSSDVFVQRFLPYNIRILSFEFVAHLYEFF